jgi:hypothetical protein
MQTKQTQIVALSGGKDSTALALALRHFEPKDYIYIANPTGNELPEMEQHLQSLEGLLGAPIHRIGCGLTFEELVRQEEMIPNFRARFCTRILKIEPTQEFLKQFEHPVLHVGLRADEQMRKGVDYGVECRFPFREWGWGLKEVLSFLDRLDITIPKRTDCAWCFFQRIDEWWNLWFRYRSYWLRGERIERDLGHTFRTPGKDNWPTAMKDLRKTFEKGHSPRKAPLQSNLMSKCAVCKM